MHNVVLKVQLVVPIRGKMAKVRRSDIALVRLDKIDRDVNKISAGLKRSLEGIRKELE